MGPLPRNIENLSIGLIHVGDRLRSTVDPARVASLAESIKAIGLLTPITYRTLPEVVIDGETIHDVPSLITGRHRLEACKLLGLETIPCIEIDAGDIDAQLWEIAENLHRAELTALQRDEHIAKWIELSDAKLAQVEPVSGGRGKTGGTRAAARELGIEKEDARRAVKTASLTDEAKAAAKEEGLDDNRTALLEAAKAAPAQQAGVIRDYADKKKSDRTKLDGDVKSRAAREVASMLAEHIPGEWWDALKANLYAAGAANIATELTNITGQSIMDRRYGA